ncbi:TylF/MycF/NovP-related O-methyltransferase [Sphingomonas sp. DG1-23]|uniref:TylF/MycF/NovP-related O-methyltransferase n=1 Tax=Sphingomonas sp. DG1-23 TaxID=3068316 RepID=UPI00273EF494|nr:TylF/MycF/NovP-related O-methyltransferase [Sphingomonas sp. DG1-23]MDP5281079.1 TylF/MycF/NovP-related O-methyltransferase [Sphingomonas sp. DG1-23]
MPHYVPDSTVDAYEAENSFYLRSHPSRMAKLLAHYELYRKITHLPGAVVEMGVYKGASLMRFATFRNILENPHSRPLIGFDAFGAFPRDEVAGTEDREFIERFETAGGPGISRDDLTALIAEKRFDNISLVEGNIFETLPAFLESKPALKIALLHLDLDVYEPTAFVLQRLLPHMVRGGLVVFDDYGMVEGATRAADAICAELGVTMAKLSNYEIPAYFTVP